MTFNVCFCGLCVIFWIDYVVNNVTCGYVQRPFPSYNFGNLQLTVYVNKHRSLGFPQVLDIHSGRFLCKQYFYCVYGLHCPRLH